MQDLPALPVGISDIHQLLSGRYVYVDKTGFISAIIHYPRVYIASPHGFGKSTLVSTLAELFRNGPAAFEGKDIYETWPEDKCYYVITIKLHGLEAQPADRLEYRLCLRLVSAFINAGFKEAEAYLNCGDFDTLSVFLTNIVNTHHVVILIDDWDYPLRSMLCSNLDAHQTPLWGYCSSMLKVVFDWLHDLPNLHFCLVTGELYGLSAHLNLSNDFVDLTISSYLGFTDDRSHEMLDSAKTAYENLFALNYYQLVPITSTTQEDIKNEYRKIFLTKNSQESILEVQHSDDGNYDTGFGHKLDRDAAAPHFTGTTCAYTPTQNHIDEYGMREGLTYDPQNPYEGRDYRFYANILYDGSTYNGHVMDIHYTRNGNEEVAGEDLTPYGTSTTAAVTRTGYYMGKFVNEQQQINNDEAYASSQNYIIWRYAEALLDYAEVMFRLGDTGTALQKVNDIRQRVHMNTLPTLTWDQLVNERRVEMAFEETTYWDIFRWGIAEEKLNGSSNPIKAIKIVQMSGRPTQYTISNMDRFPQRVRIFQKMQYYLPIPWDEIRYHGVEQNPDWTES